MAENIVRLLKENDLSYIEIKRLLRLSDEELTKVLDRLINDGVIILTKKEKYKLVELTDLRKGRIERIFGLKNKPGLSNLLLDDIYAYQDYIYTTDIGNLSVLPIGIVPPNPSELLGSEKCQILFRYLKQDYDLIILDCPPIADVADALVLSKIADEAVIVCAANYTPADELTSTKKALEQSGIKIAGVVVNKVEKDKKKRY